MEKLKKPRITWKREPRATGLAGVVQGPRPYNIKIDGYEVGAVSCSRWRDIPIYYWCVRSYAAWGIAWRNTAAENRYFTTEQKAQEACEKYVRECIERKLKENENNCS